jgi:MFS family permease
VLAAAASGIVAFALVQALIGFASAAGFGPLIADVSHWFRRRRGVAVALAASGNYLAGAAWPLALRGVVEAEGWRAAYLAIAATCVLALPPLALALRRRPTRAGSARTAPLAGPEPQLQETGRSPRTLTLLLGVAGVGCCVAMSMPQVHIVAYCADLGYGVAVGAEMLAVMLGAGILSRLVSGLIADRIGGVRTLLIGSVLQALALALYLPFDGLASLYVVSLVFGLSQGGIVPSYALIVREYLPAKEAGGRIGFVIMATILGMALGGWMSGAILDLTGSYQMAFLNGIAWNLLNIAIMTGILLRGRKPPDAAARPA